MAVDPLEIATSLYAGTFDPHNSGLLKVLNDAHAVVSGNLAQTVK